MTRATPIRRDAALGRALEEDRPGTVADRVAGSPELRKYGRRSERWIERSGGGAPNEAATLPVAPPRLHEAVGRSDHQPDRFAGHPPGLAPGRDPAVRRHALPGRGALN